MKQSTLLMLIVSIVNLGQLTLVDSAQAKPDNITTDSVNSPIINTGNIGRTLDGTFNPGTESFIFNDLSGGFGISNDVINALSDPNSNSNIATGSTRRNSTTDNEGSAVLGSDDSFEITICSSDPCIPQGDTEAAITLNDLAKLIEEDLNQSFNDLLAAEQLEQELADQPKRIIKRTSRRDSTNCVSPAIEARQEFEEKLENYQEFVTEMDRFKPENDAW